MKSTPSVLLCADKLDRVETAVALGLARNGFRVRLLVSPEVRDRTAVATKLEVSPFRVRHRLDLAARRRLRLQLSEDCPDILLAPTNRTLAAALSAAADMPCKIVGYRGTVGHLSRFDPAAWMTYLHPRLDHIICVSDAVGKYLVERIGLPADRVTRIYKGHDPSWYASEQPAPDLSRFGIPGDALTAVFAGEIRPVKGVDTLIAAMDILAGKTDLHLLLIGNTRTGREQKLAGRSPARHRIHFAGYRTDAVDLLRSCDIFVMPSRAREGLPRAVLEAMCLGMPCVASASGGLPELIDHGRNGILVAPDDPPALAHALAVFCGDPDFRRKAGRAARVKVEAEFNISRTIKETVELFRSLLEGTSERVSPPGPGRRFPRIRL